MRPILRLIAFVTLTMSTFYASGQVLSSPFPIRFLVDKATIDWGTPHNQQVHQELDQFLSKVQTDKVDTVYITSGMSPKGTNRINVKLAIDRSRNARSFILSNYHIDIDRIVIDANWQMWDTMIRAIKADTDVPQQQKTLDMLDKHYSSQEEINQALANFEHLYPDTYLYLREYIFPALCTATIQIKLK